MKKFWKILLIVLAVLLAAVVLLFAWLTITEYRPDPVTALDVASSQDGALIPSDRELSIMSWNIGYAGLGEDSDFFMDGGTESRAWSKERLEKNLDAIGETAAAQDADLILLQEVDFDSDRSYHVDEALKLRTFDGLDVSTDSVFAVNYHSAYLFYPITQPHGASNSGLLTTSKLGIRSAVRRSLPVETGVTKLLDLDRCYSVHRIPVADGGELVLYNLHLSAYTSDGTIAMEQLKLLLADMQSEYDAGNWCVAGGDFNKDLLGDSAAWFGEADQEYSWAQPIPAGTFEGLDISLVTPLDKDDPVPSCRNADGPYHQGQYVLTVDGFLVTANVTAESAVVIDTGFAWSDHNPVAMTFTLRP